MRLAIDSLALFLRNHTRRTTLHFAMLGAVLAVVGLLSMFVLSSTVYAAGGVGSGGSGAGGPGGHNTIHGWGWAIYATAGPGPTDGFRNGGSWAGPGGAQEICQGANAANVYAHVILNSGGTGRVYDYWSIEETFSDPPNHHYVAGEVIDGVLAIDTSQAENAFNNLGSFGVDTTGFTFGDNVGWFCYDFAPPPPPPPPEVTVQMQAFKVDAAGNYMGDVGSGPGEAPVTIGTCNPKGDATQVRDPVFVGMIRFQIDKGGDFCVVITSPPPRGYGGPFIRPRFDGYLSPTTPACPGFPGGPPWNNHCFDSRYDWQTAGEALGNQPQINGVFYDRTLDTGFDFVYLPMSCGGWTTLPANPEVGEPFTMTAAFVNPRGTLEYNMRLSFSTPGIVAVPPLGEQGPFTINGDSITGTATWGVLTAAASGYYAGTYTVHDNTPQRNVLLTCPFDTRRPPNPLLPPCLEGGCPLPIVTKPYFQLSGGDIATGITPIPPGCPGWGVGGGGTLTAWNNGVSSAGNRGAGTNLAAFALGLISGFASAQPPSDSSPPKDLSFSNTAGDPTYGGSFGGGITCPTDYYATLPTAPLPLAGAILVPDDSSNYYANVGPLTILGGNIGMGHRPIIYVNGDAYITGNIVLAPGAATVSVMPNFYLVVKGNIYIAPTVSRLDGVYVAQPDGANGGKIYTCVPLIPFVPPTKIELNGVCKTTQLTVNGAFIAKELKLYRSFGSMLTTGPAEQFNYTPATWLATPSAIGGNGTGGYEAISSLPPVL